MIGIIGAMTVEVEGLKAKMTDCEVKKTGGMEFVSGRIDGQDVVAAVSGEGKVNAAMCTQAMILEYNPMVIVNTGVGGGLAEGLKVGDIVVGTKVAQHDMDMSPLGYEKGYVCGIDAVYVDCDKRVSDALCDCLEKDGCDYRAGIIVSGDQFVASDDKKRWLTENFDGAVCEMEGAAIGHVCARNQIPFGVIRAISDGGDDEADISFPEFAEAAAKRSVKIVTDFVKTYNK